MIKNCGDCKYAWEHCNDPKSPCYNCKEGRNFIAAKGTPLNSETLEYAAKWIENSLVGETNERTVEFGKNMAMSIRAAKPLEFDVSMTQNVLINIKTEGDNEQ